MSRWDKSSLEQGTKKSSIARRALSLWARAGHALGLGGASGRSREVFENLENRLLLDGSFDAPIATLTFTAGQASSASQTIDPANTTSDNDIFRFVAPINGFISVLADTTNEAAASNLNTLVEIFNTSRTLIASGTDNGQLTTGLARDGWAGFIAQAGQEYFVRIRSDASQGPTVAGSYTLRVNAENIGFDIDPNTGIARELGSPPPGNPPPPGNTAIVGTIDRLQQDRVFTYTVPGTPAGLDSLITINAQVTQANLNIRLDSRVDVYRQVGTTPAVTRIAFDSDAGRINDAFTTLRARPGETYFIRVRSDEVRPNVPATPTGTGSFFLVLDAAAQTLAMNPVTRRGQDPGNAFPGFDPPTTAPTPAVPNPNFQTALYRFTSQGSGLAIITAIPVGLFPVTDPALRLYDADGNLLAFNDNFAGASPQLEVQLVGGREYFVVIDGFEINSLVQYAMFVESNHTFNPAQPIDDHINTPAGGTPAQLRRLLEQATPVVWSAPITTQDADNNLERDRGMRVTATGEGRIHEAGDTDLFQFTPPADMLGSYDGDNDEDGTSLFVGGRFDVGDPSVIRPTTSRALSIWDADDWWYTGRQDQTPAGVQLGFTDNPATPGSTRPEILTLQEWDIDGAGPTRPFLFIGGDFNLTFLTPAGPVTVTNLAVWGFSATAGRYVWFNIGNADGPVRAMTLFDAEDPDGTGPGPDPGVVLALGGDFLNIGGVAANRVATFDGAAYTALGGGITGPNASVRALTQYNPEDPGDGRAAQPGPPPLGAVVDPPDPLNSLFVGGVFTTAGGVASANLARWDGTAWFTPTAGTPVPPWSINGAVNALTTMTMLPPPGQAAFELEESEVLVVGGTFTNIGGVAANRVATWGWKDNSQDTQAPVYTPRLIWAPLGGGVSDGEVLALRVWDPSDSLGDFDPILVVGGAFTNVDGVAGANNLTAWIPGPNTWSGFGPDPNAPLGTNGPVRALTSFSDAQEISVPALDREQEVLYIGGDFTLANGLRANRIVQFFANPDPNVFSFQFRRLGAAPAGGVDFTPAAANGPSVFALAAFDDGITTRWDRHDRQSSRLQLVLNPAGGSFLNTRVRVFDSNFNVVYDFGRPGSETISPPFPDPSGMLDPTLQNPAFNQAFEGIEVWGGETYYIEVSGTGTGRYSFTLSADAVPTDINGDGRPDEVNGSYVDEPGENDFTRALRINTGLTTGDGNNVRGSDTLPFKGNQIRTYKTAPSVPALVRFASDLGNISSIDDTDLYVFRAEQTGTAEIRISTTNILDRHGEQILNADTGEQISFRGLTKVLSSRLDAAIRVFDNDFFQIGFADDNYAVTGDVQTTFVGGQQADFTRRDPRLVIPVVAGNFYYIQVESGQRWKIGAPQFSADRTANINREIDWRFATGGYALLLHQNPQQIQDLENGVPVSDDHTNLTALPPPPLTPVQIGQIFGGATVIPVGDRTSGSQNGRGSITGVINNTPLNPGDTDLFTFTAVANGQVQIRLTPTGTPSTLLPLLQAAQEDGEFLGEASPLGGGVVQLTLNLIAGQRVMLLVAGQGGSEGAYRIDITGATSQDDNANFGQLWNATDLRLLDFLGQGSAQGVIEQSGDTDIFRFRVDTFEQFRITVTAQSSTLVPTFVVYEMSEDPSGNPIMLRIAESENTAGTASTTALFGVAPNRIVQVPPPGVNRDYPFYYVLVRGRDLSTDFGSYTVSLTFPPTDDHADATNTGGVFDTAEIPLATRIAMDTASGLGTGSGRIELASDSDLFVFTAPAGGQATVIISRPAGSTIRPRVSIISSTGQLIQPTVDGADSTFLSVAQVSFNVTRGTDYYIVVAGATPNVNTTVTGNYVVNVTAPPIDDYPNASEFDLAAPIGLNPTTGGGSLGGTTGDDPLNPRIQPANDTDLFTFVTLVAGDVTVTVTPFDSTAGQLTARVRIFSSTFTQLFDTGTASPLQQRIVVIPSALAGQRFYVLVSAAANDPISSGDYRIAVQGPTPTQPPPGGDPSVVDFANPGIVPVDGGTGRGSRLDVIEVINDRDLYTFSTLAAGPVFVQVVTPSGSLLSASVRVLTAPNELPGSTIAFSATGIPGTTASVAFNATAGTQYWVIVDGLGDSTGSYELRVSVPPLVYEIYFPEGFVNDRIREFVSVVNPNNVDVSYTVILRYEFGDLETVLSSNIVRANGRDGVTISDGANFRPAGVRAGVPYSLIVRSSLPLGATIAHYDFGATIGESFTDRVAPTALFPRVERENGRVMDFVVFYNPNPFAVEVTMTAYQDGRTPVSLTRVFEANRRGGFSINDIPEFPTGIFSVQLTSRAAIPANQASFRGIVASLSHYDMGRDTGFTFVGDQEGGSLSGVITNLAQGNTVSSQLTIFNPGDLPANVQITGTYARADLPQLSRRVQVPARSQVVFTGAQLGLIPNQPAGITYTSDQRVSVAANQYQRGAADSSSGITRAGTRFFYGDAFIDSARAGTIYFETLYFYNPANVASNVNVRLLFLDGSVATIPVALTAKGFSEVRLHERPEIVRDRPGLNWFGIDAQGSSPFVMTLTHYDLSLEGGWQVSGTPFGLLNELTLIR